MIKAALKEEQYEDELIRVSPGYPAWTNSLAKTNVPTLCLRQANVFGHPRPISPMLVFWLWAKNDGNPSAQSSSTWVTDAKDTARNKNRVWIFSTLVFQYLDSVWPKLRVFVKLAQKLQFSAELSQPSKFKFAGVNFGVETAIVSNLALSSSTQYILSKMGIWQVNVIWIKIWSYKDKVV